MDELIQRILDETDFANTPYFADLRDGSFEREDFLETQIQFYYAVVFFNRPMAALTLKIPRTDQRTKILKNVWEEHGEGDTDQVHGQTFMTLLKRLDGIGRDDVQSRALWPEVRAFNSLLTGVCVIDDYLIGTAMLGRIERIFSDVSGLLGEGIVARGWLPKDQLIHSDLHADLDIRHADDFFDVLRPNWKFKDRGDRYFIEQGLRLGAHMFDTLYRGLHAARKRRAFRDYTGPHSPWL